MCINCQCPEESLPTPCEICESHFSEVGSLCVMCAMRAAVDDDDKDRAYAIASDFGYPGSTVRRMIRDRDEQRLRDEIRLMKLDVAAALAAVRPSNVVKAVAVNRGAR